MNLTASVETAEYSFRQLLEDFFISVYNEKNLYSHGIEHHRRVWYYARELLLLRYRPFDPPPSCNPSKLIIACYLHDIGMAADPGPQHGKHGREICELFLTRNNLDPAEYIDALDAIEFHDRKKYLTEINGNDLLTILAVADDLDAFGYMGIYRYSEIYLARGISPHSIGQKIRENAGRRFANFERIFHKEIDYVRRHRARFEVLNKFFTGYDELSGSYDFQSEDLSGYCGLIRLFILVLEGKISFLDLFDYSSKFPDDIIIVTFLNGLRSELNF